MLGIFKRHKNDFSSLRSHVVGEDFGMPEQPDELSSASFDRQMGRGRFAKEAALQGRDVGYGNEYNPQSFEATLEPVQPLEMPAMSQGSQSGGSNYDVMDRLAFIENQLSAIKSQVELVNERLKNIDTKLGTRRY